MTESVSLLVYEVGNQRFALPVSAVKRVLLAALPTPLSGSPDTIAGLLNVQGEITLVVDARRVFGFSAREMELSDRLIVLEAPKGSVALWVDKVVSVIERPTETVVSARELLPGLGQVRGVTKLDDDLLLIHGLEGILSQAEETTLDAAMSSR